MGIKISNSKANTFRRCRRKYYYKYDMGLKSKEIALPLKRGSWIHELLEADAKGENWKKKHKELTAEYDKLFMEEKDKYGPLPEECARMMKAYKYHWREEDEGMEILATELELEVPLPHDHTFVARIDQIRRDEWGIWIVEHKTHAKFPSANWRFIDVQSAVYAYAIEKDGRFGKVTGILWDYIRTKSPTVPHLNKDGTLSKRKIDTDLLTFVTALKNYGIDLADHRDVILSLKKHNTFFKRERVPRDKVVVKQLVKELVHTADEIEKGVSPFRSIDKSCEYMCEYMDICLTDLYGGDSSGIIRSKFNVEGGEDAKDEKVYEDIG